MRPSGVTACLNILAASALGAALSRGWGVGVLFVLMAVLWSLRQRAVLRAALARSFLVFAAVIVLSAYLAAAGSLERAVPSALVMLGRAITIIWAVAGLAASASVEDLAYLGSRIGLRGLGFALGTAANAVTRSATEMREVWWTVRMRRGRRPGLRDWRRLALAALARTVLRADEIATAAEARGLDPSAWDGAPIAVTRADRAWSAAAWISCALAVTIDLLSRR